MNSPDKSSQLLFSRIRAKDWSKLRTGVENQNNITTSLDLSKVKNPFEKVLNDCKLWDKVFVDPDFPPNEQSLSKNFAKLPAGQQTNWKRYVWRRPKDFFQGQYSIFLESIEPNDIKQGKLGDCYLLSSLSSLTEHPYWVIRLFHKNEINEYGVYGVWLNVNGEWKNIVVDDNFPCLNENSGPVFSRANGNELWVLLLEKAYAKIYGSYEVIEGGNPAMALRDLTGCPYENKDTLSADDFWNYIKENYDKGFILTCYTKSTATIEEENELGLLSGHAYAILDARMVTGSDNLEDRIIKIRNPWGSKEWSGPWGDSSSKWTEKLRKDLEVLELDDGTFWISVNDFVKFFEGVGICKVHEKYQYDSLKFEMKSNNFVILKMKITKPTHLYLSSNQVDERFFQDKKNEYHYSHTRILVAKCEPSGLQYKCGAYSQSRNLTIENKYEPGIYIVVVEIDWMQDLTRTIVLSSYGETRAIISVLDEEHNLLRIQRNILKSYAQSEREDQKITDYSRGNQPLIKKSVGYAFGLLYFVYYNGSEEGCLVESVEMTKLEGLKACSPVQDQMRFKVIVPVSKEVVVLYKFVPTQGPSVMSYGYKTESKLTTMDTYDEKEADPEFLANTYIEKNIDSKLDHLELGHSNSVAVAPDQVELDIESPEERKKFALGCFSAMMVYFLACETGVWTGFDKSIGSRIKNWAMIFLVSLIVSLVFIILQFFVRTNYLDLMIIIYLVLMASRGMLTQHDLRYSMLYLLLSFILDVLWLSSRANYWIDDPLDRGMLNGVKKCSVAFTITNMIFKVWLTPLIWRTAYRIETMRADLDFLLAVPEKK